jgi:hypothetical protein
MAKDFWRQVRGEDLLWLAAREHGFVRQRAIMDALAAPPYSLARPAEGYLSGIMNGKRDLPNTVLGAALLHLFGMSLADLGLSPSEYQTVWAHLELARQQGGWPQPDGNGDTNRRNEQVRPGSGRSSALAGHNVLAASGVNRTAAA